MSKRTRLEAEEVLVAPPHLDDLPDEILLSHILRFMSGPDLGRMACTSRRFNGLCGEEELWRALMHEEVSGVTLDELAPAISWRSAYRQYALLVDGLELSDAFRTDVARAPIPATGQAPAVAAPSPELVVASCASHIVCCHPSTAEDGVTKLALFREPGDMHLLNFAPESKCSVKKMVATVDCLFIITKSGEAFELKLDGSAQRLSKDALDICLWRGVLWLSSTTGVSCWSAGRCFQQFGDMMPLVQFKVCALALGLKCNDGFRVWDDPESAPQLLPSSEAFELDDPVYAIVMWGPRLAIASNGLCIFRGDRLEHKMPALSSGCTYEQLEVLGDVLIGACNHKLTFFNHSFQKIAELHGAVYSGRMLLLGGLVVWHDSEGTIHLYTQRGVEVTTASAPEKDRMRHLHAWKGQLLVGYRGSSGVLHKYTSRPCLQAKAQPISVVVSDYALRSRAGTVTVTA